MNDEREMRESLDGLLGALFVVGLGWMAMVIILFALTGPL